MPVMDTDYLVGAQEISERFHVNKSTANNWVLRAGYPKPVVTHLSRGPLYDIREVEKWWINWVPGKSHKKVGYLEQREQRENGQTV